MVKAGNDKFTISVDKSVKNKFKKLCEENGLAPGKQIELFLMKKIKELER
jgi:antitoxin component of RelBE/YafQ-DinJ toxin-antitoxin module